MTEKQTTPETNVLALQAASLKAKAALQELNGEIKGVSEPSPQVPEEDSCDGEEITSADPNTAAQYANLRRIELQILKVEGVCVIFRCEHTRLIPGVGYPYTKALKKTATVGHLLKRIKYALRNWGGYEIPFEIVSGTGKIIRKGCEDQSLAKIISTYKKSI